MTEKKCAVCGRLVAEGEQDRHLELQHLGPHYFWFGATPYRTEKPSMTAGELLQMMERTYGQLVEDRDGELIYYSHSMAVNLTRRPQFFLHTPCTPHQGLPE